MADIDFITDLTAGFVVSLGDNPLRVVGNRALMNRFEITFLTKAKTYVYNGVQNVTDTYAGNAQRFIENSTNLTNPQNISAAVLLSITDTVNSMKSDEPAGLPDTEKLDSAKLVSLDMVGGRAVAVIKVVPVQAETSEDFLLNMPIIRT